MNKNIWLVVLLTIIIIALVGIFILWPVKTPVSAPVGIEGLQIISPTANAEISSPLKITGGVSGNGWAGFEGQVGTVRLLDASNNELALGILTATTDWMQPIVNFETTLEFQSDTAQAGNLVFHNENPSGDPVRDRTFTLPVKITKSANEMMTVKIFLTNAKLDPGVSCYKVFPLEREIPKTQAVARAALEELIMGTTSAEKEQGYSGGLSYNPGIKIQSLTVENGIAKVDFNNQLQDKVGGSCRVTAIRSEITETLKQFPTVDSVVISIDGKTEDILQP